MINSPMKNVISTVTSLNIYNNNHTEQESTALRITSYILKPMLNLSLPLFKPKFHL